MGVLFYGEYMSKVKIPIVNIWTHSIVYGTIKATA